MSCPRIAIATCAGYDDHKAGDELLREAMEAHGAEVHSAVWDEEGTDWSEFDLCLVRSTWDYHEKHREFLDWARRVEAVTALQNPADLIAWNSDKTYLRELGEAGVRTVPTVWVERGSEVDLAGVLAAKGWAEVVVKPVVDLGARNLRRARAAESAAALKQVQHRGDAMVQPFLPSIEEQGELSLIYIDEKLTHAVRKQPAQGDFRVQSIWGGTVTRADPEPDEVELAERALAHLDEPPLYARVDLVAGLNGDPCLIELELIEPNLYLESFPPAAESLADAVIQLASPGRSGAPPQTLNPEP
jgi:glutathione synthase/RimK-type ligase-like ATP-grasp enzyme